MDKINRERYKTLKFLSDNTRAQITTWKEKGLKEYENNVPKHVEDYLVKKGFIDLRGNSRDMITDRGLAELKTLQVIRYQYLSLVISIVSILLSILALIKVYNLP